MNKLPYIITMTLFLSFNISGCDNTAMDSNQDVDASTKVSLDNTTIDSNENLNLPVYQVAISAGYAPFEFIDAHGDIIGYDIDLLTAAGEAAGFRVEFNNMPFPKILPALEAGQYDIGVSSGFNFNEEQQAKFAQSQPYVKSQTGYWVLEDSIYMSYEDLIGQTVAVQKGTNLHQRVADDPQLETLTKPTSFLAFKSVVMQNAQANVEDEAIMFYRVDQHPDYKVRFIPFADENERLRIAVSASDNKQEIINKINAGINTIKADGTYQKINEKWFNVHAKDIAI